MTPAQAIKRYLRSGEYDSLHREWPGDVIQREVRGQGELLRALISEVKKRAVGCQHAPVPSLDLTSWTRRKVTPTVQGLFPEDEREAVVRMLAKSVVVVTTSTIEGVLLGQSWLGTASDVANMYLASVDAKMLGPKARSLGGLSQDATCFVSADYFQERELDDYVIHEAAHVFHNCKRTRVGLPETKGREWLLDIEYRKRETFAYSCEAYGWIVERVTTRTDRLAMAERFSKVAVTLTEERIHPAEVAEIVLEACAARNGWKVILRRCAPAKASSRRATSGGSIGERA